MSAILPDTKAELSQMLIEGKNRGFNRSIADVKSDLLRPLPNGFISQKPVFKQKQKTGSVPYIAWTDCLMILDYICPEYDYEVFENQLGDRCVVKGRLTLHCKERDLVVEALGNDDLGDVSYGGAVCDASAMALRRCCASLGLGRYLYDKQPHQTQQNLSKGEISAEEWKRRKAQREAQNNA